MNSGIWPFKQWDMKPMNSSKWLKYFMWKSSFCNMGKGNILEMLNWEEKGKCRARAKPVFPWHVCKRNIAVFRSVQKAKNIVYKLKSNWAVKVPIQADGLRSILPFLCATNWCHLLFQGARVWLTAPKTIRNGNSFTAFAKRSSWYHLLFWDWREMLFDSVFTLQFLHRAAKEPVAALRLFRSYLHFLFSG